MQLASHHAQDVNVLWRKSQTKTFEGNSSRYVGANFDNHGSDKVAHRSHHVQALQKHSTVLKHISERPRLEFAGEDSAFFDVLGKTEFSSQTRVCAFHYASIQKELMVSVSRSLSSF